MAYSSVIDPYTRSTCLPKVLLSKKIELNPKLLAFSGVSVVSDSKYYLIFPRAMSETIRIPSP